MPTASPFEAQPHLAAEPAAAPQRTARHRFPRVLLIRRRYLGDIVLLGSVLKNLRLHWPEAHLTVLTEQTYSAVLRLNPDVDGALVFPRRATDWFGFLRALRRAKFTHVLDFDNTEKSALAARLTGAPHRVTYERELAPFRLRWAYTAIVPIAKAFYETHPITETCLALLAPIGVPIVSRDIRLAPEPDDISWARKFAPSFSSGDRSRVLVHPGSRSPFRVWPADRFAAVCDRLQDRLGVQVLLVAGPGELSLVRSIQRQARSHLLALEEAPSVGRFAALAAQCDLLLCHDSGPMHVAASAGARVVALYGSQNARTWQPPGQGHFILQTPLPCACIGAAAPTPCVKQDGYRSYCVRMLDVETVYHTVAQALSC